MRIELFTTPLLLSLAFVSLITQASAQSLQLSKNADFSTNDGIFSFSDILHAKVTAPQIDLFDIKVNEFRLKANAGNDGNDLRGAFTNNLDGTYEAHIPLSGLDRSQSSWEFRAEIKDSKRGRFKSHIAITIQDVPGVGNSLVLTARINSIGSDFFKLSDNVIFVDNATEILENGMPLPFSALQNNWKISVIAERRNDGLFWAIRITVLQRDNTDQEVETKGNIASIGSSSIVVNNIKFIVVVSTEILDQKGNRIGLNSLQVGMFVEAKGKLNANGDVLAEKIRVEKANIGGNEIELIGYIESIDADGAQKSIVVSNTLFEVDANTEILGFEKEPIRLSDLRIGELVDVKARTRNGLAPLAESIKREDANGEDLEVEGTILAIGDSILTVGQFTFRITPSTIILDRDNHFISFFDLRTGLEVEVRANFAANGVVVATRIKVKETGGDDEIEVKGFVDTLTESSVTVSGLTFSVDHVTIVVDDNGNTTDFTALRIGMLVEIYAETSLTGALHAARIKIEDFLQDEIEIRGAITAIDNDQLAVTGITFFVDASTQITGNNGLPINFNTLASGMIVEIRADLRDGKWIASRIHIEDRIDAVVEIRGKIDSLKADGFFMLSQKIIVTNATIFLGNKKQPITFAALAPGDFVEVKAQLLPDRSLVALRVKKEDNGVDEVELSGSISALTLSSITVSGATFVIDAATAVLDIDKQPITIQDLHVGMVVEVKAQKQGDGSLLALRVEIEDRRSITGFLTAISPGIVTVQGIAHNLTEKSLISDIRNRTIDAQALKVNQLVQVVARANQSQQEVVTLHVIFENPITSVPNEQPLLPNTFSLFQNYPNPFNPSTVIRFAIPQASHIRLAVFDILGRRIRTLMDGVRTAGEYDVVWDSRDDFGNLAASGVYFYRLEANGLRQTRKLMLVR